MSIQKCIHLSLLQINFQHIKYVNFYGAVGFHFAQYD
jgi:hypothetical protein